MKRWAIISRSDLCQMILFGIIAASSGKGLLLPKNSYKSGKRTENVKKKKVFDSFALLAYLKGEKGSDQIMSHLSSDEVIINAVNLGEVFYILARSHGVDNARHFVSTIVPSLPLTCVTNGCAEVLEAARIKAEYSLSYADCFAIATALRENAPVVTGDPEFKKVEEIVRVDWI